MFTVLFFIISQYPRVGTHTQIPPPHSSRLTLTPPPTQTRYPPSPRTHTHIVIVHFYNTNSSAISFMSTLPFSLHVRIQFNFSRYRKREKGGHDRFPYKKRWSNKWLLNGGDFSCVWYIYERVHKRDISKYRLHNQVRLIVIIQSIIYIMYIRNLIREYTNPLIHGDRFFSSIFLFPFLLCSVPLPPKETDYV